MRRFLFFFLVYCVSWRCCFHPVSLVWKCQTDAGNTLDIGQLFDMEVKSLQGLKKSQLNVVKSETLNAHNNYRTLHGCPPLVWCEEIANTAQAWADKISEKGFLQYSESPTLGENICLVDLKSVSRTGNEIVSGWYKEITNYNYNKPGWIKGAHRFSQLLWKSTTEIGVGVAQLNDRTDKVFVVVNYRPAGNNNLPGEFERNVLPPKDKIYDDRNANIVDGVGE